MEVIHRLGLSWDKSKQALLAGLGIEVVEGVDAFEIGESDPRWPDVQPLISAWKLLDIVTTRFSREELRGASYLDMGPDWHHGYPQPDGAFGYLKETYDVAEYCSACGIGAKQSAPFRMKGEPKWGKRHILQLNWVFDEYFVQPDVWKTVFEPFGVGSCPVKHHRTSKQLTTVVQLSINTHVTVPSIPTPSETCPACGRAKHLHITRGMFPPVEGMQQAHIARTKEYFGSGASASNAIIVSGDLYQAIEESKLKGVHFVPCRQGCS